MCGFLGQFSKTRPILDFVDSNLDLLSLSRFRGPDASSSYCNDKNLWLGFNRLAILDTSEAGLQPMMSKTSRFAIVFNGEIYNHLELREQLDRSDWKSNSDTETILQSIEECGFQPTISKLDGMFALAVYDSVEDKLSCARDFAGIKPFFFGWNGADFVFASQYDQVIQHTLFKNNSVNPSVLRLYLDQHFVPAPFGLLEETGQLEPGEWCEISRAGMKRGFYWRMPDYQKPTQKTSKEAIATIKSSLSASVRKQLLSDVPLGAFLSGGIDSPLVCHFAAEHRTGKLKTFTIGSDSKKHNESHIAEKYSKLIGTAHHCEMMSAKQALPIFEAALDSIREPLADFSVIPTYLLSKLARNDVTVALSGDGGDELFFGYERFWSVAKNIRFQMLPWVFKAAIYKGDQLLSANRNINDIVLFKHQGYAHSRLHSRFDKTSVTNIFPELLSASVPDDYTTYGYENSSDTGQLVQAMRKAEFYGMMQKTLRKVDLASMRVSLEVRVPFLSKSFVENSLKLDPMLSYGPAKKKQMLKETLRDLHPNAPIDDIKRGFTIPLGDWFRDPGFKSLIEEKLFDSSFTDRFGMNKSAIRSLLDTHYEGTDRKWPIFTLLALQKSLSKN